MNMRQMITMSGRYHNSSYFDWFGLSVAAIGTDKVIVSADFDDTWATNTGSAYIFDVATGTLLQTINNPFPDDSDFFGVSVAAIGTDKVIVSAESDDTGGLLILVLYTYLNLVLSLKQQIPKVIMFN